MRLKRLPNETGASDERAGFDNPTSAANLIAELKHVNNSVPRAWARHGWWIVENYQRFGHPSDLEALSRHLSGIRSRFSDLDRSRHGRAGN
jgi:hypothetical protein